MKMVDFLTGAQITIRLTKSGKGVLFYWKNGETFICSKAMMQMLVEGKANGNMIKANMIGVTDENRFKGKSEGFDINKIVKTDGDPLSPEANVQRNNQKLGAQEF